MYTPEEEAYLLEHYPKKSVEEIGEDLNKSVRSVIGKLSRLKVYQKKQYVSKTGERPVTKLELCAQIARAIGLEPEEVEGLSKAPKAVLVRILGRLVYR